MWLACQKRNHAHRRKNPPVTQPPQSGNIGIIFLFCRFHNRDIDGIAIFVRLIRSINAIRKREAMASISTTAQAIPQTPSQTSSHLSMPISSTVKAVPRSGIRDVFDRALAADELAHIARICVEHNIWAISDEVYHSIVYNAAMRMSCAKACAGCAHSRNRYEKPVQGKGKTWTGTRKGREESVQTYLAVSFLSPLFGITQNLSSG